MPDSIKNVSAEEILDSRGEPTIEVTVELQTGLAAKAAVPSGASTGRFEAHELRDGDPSRYNGKGVLQAIKNVETEIRSAVTGIRIFDQQKIDDTMRQLDGTENKSRLGANAILGVSLACARLASRSLHIPLYQYLGELYGQKKFQLPIPLMNIINGGLHASTNLNLQEFWIVPMQTESFHARLRAGSEIFQALGRLLRQDKRDTDLGNEGGYAPDLDSHGQAFEYIMRAAQEAKYTLGKDVFLGLDAGSSVLYDHEKNMYHLTLEHSEFTPQEFGQYMKHLLSLYPIIAMEDPLAEEDWDTWVSLTQDLKVSSPSVKVIGDDLFVTNPTRLQKGIERGAANTILIKPNQIGTLTETLDCIRLARKAGYGVVISHRSGETIDTFIADLAVGVAAEYIKTGSVARGERSAKYNRLLSIEQELHGS